MSLISLLITVILLGLVFYVLWWALAKIALPAPFDKIAVVVLVLLVVVVLVSLVTGSISLPAFRL
ncbi:MAG: hypothetical protein ABIP06_06425 [Pyrinomonadaceae bacterium]